MYDREGRKGVIQDGNREWITVVAAICADGSALPPAIIYCTRTLVCSRVCTDHFNNANSKEGYLLQLHTTTSI
ncbi:hypothetical protein EJ07DRAFT_139946 [Lizonia empirigonia]|nr:hypothetical protein EJ07DRAFT_139946 [Lizonia empirigonia]